MTFALGSGSALVSQTPNPNDGRAPGASTCISTQCPGSKLAEIEALAAQVRITKSARVGFAHDGFWTPEACRLIIDLPVRIEGPAPDKKPSGASSATTAMASLECAERFPEPFEPLTSLRSTRREPVKKSDEQRLREILNDYAFWPGQTSGRDVRFADGHIERLEFQSGTARAFIVSSGNPSFDLAPRSEFRSILIGIYKALGGRI
jgi:hypothetical protein